MSISSPTASSLTAKIAADVGNLYGAMAVTGTSAAAAPSAKTDAMPGVVVTLSAKALDLLRARQISDDTARQFKDILARAEAADAQRDPKAFLNSLSPSDLEVLRKVHGLADAIDVPSLGREGAANLLAQPGAARDLDDNGLTSVGAANSLAFPPENAPESFKAAWASVTDGMSFAEIPTQMVFAVGLANIGRQAGDANWRNPYAEPNYDYKGAVDNVRNALKYEYAHSLIPQAQYQHDMGFYTRLANAIGQA